MLKLTKKQIGPWCTFCDQKTNRAVFVQRGWHGLFACELHKADLAEVESTEEKVNEADYQTWVSL